MQRLDWIRAVIGSFPPSALRGDWKTESVLSADHIKEGKMMVSIIVPFRNETQAVAECLRHLQPVARKIKAEIICVDDGSTDNSAELAEAELRRWKTPWRLFQQSAQGKGKAIWRGNLNASGNIIIIQDADLEYNPQDLPRLVAPFKNLDVDAVIGSRYRTRPETKVLPFWHTLANFIMTTICNMFTNRNFSDIHCGYKAFRAAVLADLDVQSRGFEWDTEAVCKLAGARYNIVEVPVDYEPRTRANGKKIHWTDGLRCLWAILRYSRWRP